jgi:copper chaperone CopZ
MTLLLIFSADAIAQHEGHHMESTAVKSEEMVNSKTDVFAVYGNCGMCQNRIESAVTDVEGVYSADWDVDEKEMTVTYNKKKVKLKAIQEAIAEVGHDTDKYRASDKVYADLPGCCQYDRPKK